MSNVLCSWVGDHDISSTAGGGEVSGPVAALLNAPEARKIKAAYLLFNYPEEKVGYYFSQLRKKFSRKYTIHDLSVELPSPMDYGAIYTGVTECLAGIEKNIPEPVDWFFHTSPGTSAISAVRRAIKERSTASWAFRGTTTKTPASAAAWIAS